MTRLCDFSSFLTLFSFIDRISFIASFVDRYLSYWTFVPVEVSLCILLMLAFVELRKLFLKVTWHCVNRDDGRIMPNPNFFLVSTNISKVPEIGISSQDRIYLETTLSILFFTQVNDKSATVRCQLTFDRTYR